MKTISLSMGQVAQVDDSDYPFLATFKWRAFKLKDTHYAVRTIVSRGNHCCVMMHRVIIGLSNSNPLEVDHIDRDGLNNQRANLRAVTHAQNQWNRRRTKGYYWDSRDKRYQAQIVFNGNRIRLGRYSIKEDAQQAYLDAKALLHVFPSHN
jgi:hypothetical protein